MKINDSTIEYIAGLSKLEVTPENKERLKDDFRKIIEYMEVLKSANVKDLEPMSHVFEGADITRPDEAGKSMINEKILENAPEKKDGYFMVPKTVE